MFEEFLKAGRELAPESDAWMLDAAEILMDWLPSIVAFAAVGLTLLFVCALLCVFLSPTVGVCRELKDNLGRKRISCFHIMRLRGKRAGVLDSAAEWEASAPLFHTPVR